ncbi:MAG: hypothetical protein ACYTGP_12780 [Planctomycetota bacterium]
MALTPHHHVHPVRRVIGLLLLLAVVIALFVVSWNQNQLADNIGASFEDYYNKTGRPTVKR